MVRISDLLLLMSYLLFPTIHSSIQDLHHASNVHGFCEFLHSFRGTDVYHSIILHLPYTDTKFL